MKKIVILVILSMVILSAGVMASEGASIGQAKQVFDRYTALERQYDIKIADLYSDEALIQSSSTARDGSISKTAVKGKAYKMALEKAIIPMSKRIKDMNDYSDVKYTVENNGVRITCKRFNEIRKTSTPFELLVGPDAAGLWKIQKKVFAVKL